MKTVAQTVIEADRFYTIAAKGGCVIQAVEKATNGGDIRLGKYEHKPEQEWAFVREGDGVYRIRNRASGKLIDLSLLSQYLLFLVLMLFLVFPLESLLVFPSASPHPSSLLSESLLYLLL